MRFQLDKDVLADAVAWTARSLPLRPSFPILAGLLIQAEDGAVALSSFDYETSARITIKAEVSQPGVALVSGRLLADITRSLPAKPVTVSTSNTEVEVVCGSARFALQTLPVDDYPTLPAVPQTSGWVDAQSLADAVGQVVAAAGRDELLPVFTGVRVEFDGANLSLLATDRYRMALKELVWQPDTAATAATAALVPGKVLADAAKSMQGGDKITIALAEAGIGDGLIGFTTETSNDTRQITTRLLDGDFPKLRHLMSIPDDLTVRANTQDLMSAVRRVALVAERNTSLKMVLGDDSVTLEAARGDQAQASEAVPALIGHGNTDVAIDAVGFNPHYLTDALSAMTTPYVCISFTGSGKPCLVRALADLDGDPSDDYRHVIMLMRLSS